MPMIFHASRGGMRVPPLPTHAVYLVGGKHLRSCALSCCHPASFGLCVLTLVLNDVMLLCNNIAICRPFHLPAVQ